MPCGQHDITKLYLQRVTCDSDQSKGKEWIAAPLLNYHHHFVQLTDLPPFPQKDKILEVFQSSKPWIDDSTRKLQIKLRLLTSFFKRISLSEFYRQFPQQNSVEYSWLDVVSEFYKQFHEHIKRGRSPRYFLTLRYHAVISYFKNGRR